MRVEQINTKEEATYLHHDQAGSTRLLTNEKGEATGTYSYTPYGATESHMGTATTPLGYDAQYTSPDTGLIYLRARVYDPATAQFLSVDPLVSVTGEPYAYAEDNPLNVLDLSGLAGCGSILIISSLCKFGQESGASEAAAGALNFLTFGASNEIAGEIFGFDSSCANFGEAGTLLGAVLGFFDGEDEAALVEAADSGATNLGEQLTMEEAQAGAGSRIMEGKINDPSYPEDVWAKMHHEHVNPDGTKTIIHYWENPRQGSGKDLSSSDVGKSGCRSGRSTTWAH